MRTTINVTPVNIPSEAAIEEASEVAEAGVGGMIVTVTVTGAKIGALHTEDDEVDPEALPVDMVADGI